MKLKNALKKQVIFLIITALTLSFSLTALASSDYTEDGATKFTFSNSAITATDGDYTDYKINGTDLTIKGSGTYTLDGSCENGTVTVKKGTTGVTLVLKGLSLKSTYSAPITCNKSSEVKIVVAQNTENTLTDTANNNDDNYPDNTLAENAVLKCKDGSKITLCGSGTLNINANGKNGIKSGATTDDEGEAYLIIKDVTLNITASVNDGINAESTLNILSGNLTIDANDDGIHSDYLMNIGAENTEGPTIKITNSYEGLEAANLNVYSGNITIYSSDDCMNAANSDLTDYSFTLNIAGGTLYMYTTSGDGIDSNGTLTISGGTVEVWSANTADNQPLDADSTISITGGTVFAAGGSAGMGLNLSASQPYIIYGSNSSSGNQGSRPGAQNKPNSNQSSISKGSTVAIKDSSGNTVYTATAPCNASYIVFSDKSLTSSQSYSIYANNTSLGSVTAQTGTSSGNQGENGGQGGNQPTPPSGKPEETPPTPPANNTPTTSTCTNGHTYTSAVTTTATCTSNGVKIYTCSKCGYSYTENLPTISHSYQWVTIKKATYFSKGKKVYKCSVCGNILKTQTISKLKLSTPKFSVKAKNNKILIKYKKSTNATGFVVKYNVNGKWITEKFSTKTSATKAIKALKSGKYKIKIRSFIRQNGKIAYSNWSNVKSITIK